MTVDELFIPTKLEEITPAWMTDALSGNFPGVNVEALTTEVLHDGTAFTCRVNLTYAAGSAAAPSTVCVKAGMDAPHRGLVVATGMCCKEAITYRDVMPFTGARVAQCFASGYDMESGKAFVMLEDLNAAGAEFCGAERPLTPEQVGTGLAQLAELHAFHWKDPRIEDQRWRHRGLTLGDHDMLMRCFTEEAWPRVMEMPHAGAVAVHLRRADVLGPAVAKLRALDHASATCLIHGDAHIGNFFIDAENRACMADFQGIQRGHYTHDIALFMASALDVVDRRQHERDLLQGYLNALEALVGKGNGPTFADAWLGYRRHILYGMWVWLLTSNTYQNDRRLVATVYRFGMAALDLDSLAALDE
jgi:hypothetical protein